MEAERLKRAQSARKLYDNLRCPKCKEIASHSVPPSLSEEGFFVGEEKSNE